jgi:SOS response regulatory protein OraA/RecX
LKISGYSKGIHCPRPQILSVFKDRAGSVGFINCRITSPEENVKMANPAVKGPGVLYVISKIAATDVLDEENYIK